MLTPNPQPTRPLQQDEQSPIVLPSRPEQQGHSAMGVPLFCGCLPPCVELLAGPVGREGRRAAVEACPSHGVGGLC